MKKNILFVCSRNQWRSPTAEKVWRHHPQLQTRSVGTSSKARRTISVSDVHWADLIFVMEFKHKAQLKKRFREVLQLKTIHVLDIPDEYQYMDPELVHIIQEVVGRYLE